MKGSTCRDQQAEINKPHHPLSFRHASKASKEESAFGLRGRARHQPPPKTKKCGRVRHQPPPKTKKCGRARHQPPLKASNVEGHGFGRRSRQAMWKGTASAVPLKRQKPIRALAPEGKASVRRLNCRSYPSFRMGKKAGERAALSTGGAI